MTSPHTLELISDFICPWCYIGKHRLQLALKHPALNDFSQIEIKWRPYELNPGLPKEGMDRKEYCRIKFGSAAYAESIYENIARNAQQDGLLFHHDRITRTPNTRAAHRLTSFAQQQGEASVLVDELVNRLFVSYFVDGKNIGDHDVLTELAINAGLEKQAVVELLSSDTGTTEVIALEESAYDLGVMGVPGFVMDGVLILSGAQDPETIATRIAQTLERKSASMVSN